MTATNTADYQTILTIVRDWPPAQQFMLVREVLRTLAPDAGARPPGRETLAAARGLLATDRPAPTDQEITRWLEERRTERYGQ